jgi:hypothetical protein
MAAPTFSDNRPTGNYEKPDASILVSIDHATGVDEDTINVTLTDPLGTAYSPVTSGVFDTANNFVGDIVAAGTNADVVIRGGHDPFMAGTWTVAVNADSDTGGEVGSTSWTFSVFGELSSTLQGIIDIMEGSAGVGRTIPVNEFRYLESIRDGEESKLAPTGETRPFMIADLGPADAQDNPGYVSGDYVWDSSVVRVTVLYYVLENQPLELEQTMADHRKMIRRAMEWPRNWGEVQDGWCGCEVVGIDKEAVTIGEGDKEDLLFVHYDLQVQTREKHEY